MNFGYFLKERQRIEGYLKGYLTLISVCFSINVFYKMVHFSKSIF